MIEMVKVTPSRRTVKLKGRKKGIIYKNPSKLGKVVFYLSDLVVLAAMAYLFFLYQPLTFTVANYLFSKRDEATISSKTNKVAQAAVETKKSDNKIPEKFKINIPRINADTWVVPNVSPFDVEEYNKVLSGNVIAHAKGSNLPGSGNGSSIYMFAHSSEPIGSAVRNNPVFYLLGDMKNDDKIIIDYNGEKYIYKVYDKKVINANDIEYLNYSDPSREVAILQTCWPIGTNWKRLLIFGELVKEEI